MSYSLCGSPWGGLLGIEDGQEVFCVLNTVWRESVYVWKAKRSFQYGRPLGGLLCIEGRQEVFYVSKTICWSALLRRPSGGFNLLAIDPDDLLLLPIFFEKESSSRFSLQKKNLN